MTTGGLALASAVDQEFSLTPMQHGMVVESALSDRPWTNLQQIVCRLDHRLEPDLLREAWRQAQDRHPMLRARMEWSGHEEPRQVVLESAPLPWDHLDWSDLAPDATAHRLDTLLAEDREQGVDVRIAPGQRLTLIDHGADRSTLIWTFHHAFLDGRGFTVVLEDVFETYDALVTGATPAVAAPTATFADHVAAVQAEPEAPAVDYFTRLLEGFAAPISLPITVAQPDPSRGHDSVEVELPEPDVRAIDELAVTTDTTTATCVLAAWAIVLGRYSGRADVVFGATRSGRHTIGGADAVAGCFINTLPVRADVTDDVPLVDLLQSIRADQVDIRPFEQTSLILVQQASEVPRATPLLSTNVVFERYAMNDRLRARGGAWSDRTFEVHEEGGFGLTLAAYHDTTLRLCLEFDPALYDADLVVAMADHLATVLRSMVQSRADVPIGSLAMVAAAEAESLAALGRPPHPVTASRTWIDGLDESIASHPDAVAVESPGEEPDAVTYRELDALANQIGDLLISRAVEPGDRVLVCLPRSIHHVAALIAAGRVGATFVPIDPTYPRDALEHMIQDSGGRIVLTHSSVAASVPAGEVPVVALDSGAELRSRPTSRPEATPATLDDPAYVIYTSGSSGRPKGVVVSHRAVAGHAAAWADNLELGPADGVLQFASLSFDVSIEEIIPSLLSGCRLSLRTPEMAQSISTFLIEVERRNLSVINLPSAFWSELVHHLDARGAGLPPAVRVVIAGGQKVSATDHRRWKALAPGVRWLNGYGPTECTITSTVHEPARARAQRLTTEVPIGRPTANARAYVVDERGALAPIGIAGELWLGGLCVAEGYLGRDDLTRDRFLTDPFAPTTDDGAPARVYRTGDLVRWLPSGDLEFMGRVDRQIKLKGFRIEPGEIEAVIERHPAVAQARAAVYSANGQPALGAWIRAVASADLDLDAIQNTLRSTLPRHMVPEGIVEVDRFPVTASGKIDERALPAPVGPGTGPDTTQRAEIRDDLDRTIDRLFADILDIDDIDGNASFFDLGGHSLLAVRLLDAIEHETGVLLTLPTLHEAPTPRAIADLLRDGDGLAEQYRHLYPIQPLGSRPPIFGLHVLGKNGFFYRPLAAQLGADQPLYGLGVTDITGPLDAPTDVDGISEAYCQEILRCAPTGPVTLAAVSMGSIVAVETGRRLVAAGREAPLILLFDAIGPGDFVPLPRHRWAWTHLKRAARNPWGYASTMLAKRRASRREQRELGRVAEELDTGGELTPEQRFLQFSNANAAAQAAYRPEPYPGPLALFLAEDEPFANRDWRLAGMGWSEFVLGDLHVSEVPGQHLSILAEPNVATLADQMRVHLPD